MRLVVCQARLSQFPDELEIIQAPRQEFFDDDPSPTRFQRVSLYQPAIHLRGFAMNLTAFVKDVTMGDQQYKSKIDTAKP